MKKRIIPSLPCNNGGRKGRNFWKVKRRGEEEEFYGEEMKIKRKSRRQLIELRKQQHN